MEKRVNESLIGVEYLHEQELGIVPAVVFRYGKLIGQEFVNGPGLFFHQVEKGIEPAGNGKQFKEEDIETVFLFDMKQFMPEYLFAFAGVQFDLAVPEQPAEKGVGRTRFIGIQKTDLIDLLHRVSPDDTPYLQQ
jgi:hypothetical protein